MGWVERLFDRRDAWLRLVLLDLSGLGYLYLNELTRPSPPQLILALGAFVAILALIRWPLVSLLVQTALLVLALLVVDDPTINVVGSSWMLAELVAWAARPVVYWSGTVLLLAVHVVLGAERPVELLLPVGLPLLLGLVVRTNHELGEQRRRREAEEARRRESEARADRADERSAIARELHDVVAHHVASMVLRVGVARHVVPGLDPRISAVLDDVHGTGTTALADLRRLVAALRDPSAVRGDAAFTAIEPGALPAALGAAVERARMTGLTVEADIDEAVGGLDAVRAMAVLRLTQEALTNVAKHAGPAAVARLRVSVEEENVWWEVADEGGAPPASAPPGGGHGLTGMHERVAVLGGELTAGPAGSGWRVSAVLPAHNGAAEGATA
ncbi:histidine kinase [Actinoplanes sp. NPDC048796]|uniref:sensor histidine kinase n=1 Tax=Actinoplanes sp. NPDC048796 TaxID=3155640 RepID=UPI0033C6C2BE